MIQNARVEPGDEGAYPELVLEVDHTKLFSLRDGRFVMRMDMTFEAAKELSDSLDWIRDRMHERETARAEHARRRTEGAQDDGYERGDPKHSGYLDLVQDVAERSGDVSL